VRRGKILRCMSEGFRSIRSPRPGAPAVSEHYQRTRGIRVGREGPTKEPERVGRTRRERRLKKDRESLSSRTEPSSSQGLKRLKDAVGIRALGPRFTASNAICRTLPALVSSARF